MQSKCKPKAQNTGVQQTLEETALAVTATVSDSTASISLE